MNKILKIIRKRIPLILLVFIMLIAQANFDLKIPEYTADIINVGITQNGIENVMPEILTKNDYQRILTMLTSSEKDQIFKNYSELNGDNFSSNEKENLKEKYNIKEGDFVLTGEDNLEELFTKINLLYMAFTTENPEMPSDADMFIYLNTLNETEKIAFISETEETINKNIPEDTKSTVSIQTVQTYYENAGTELEKIQQDYILSNGIIMILLAFGSMILTILTVLTASRLAASISKELRSNVVNQVMDYSNTEFEEFSTSSLITRSTNDIQQIQMFIVFAVRIVFYAPIIGLGAFAKVSESQMNWVIGISILSILSLVIILFSFAIPKFKSIQLKIDKLNLLTREFLTGISVIRAFSTESYEEKRFDKANKDLTKTNLFVNRIMGIMFPSMMFIMNATSILIVWAGAKYVDAGTLQIGDIMATMSYAMYIIMAFLMFSMISIMMPRAIVSVKRINEVLKKESTIKNPENPTRLNPKDRGVVEFKNVSFKYADAEEAIIRNVSFKAEPGKTTAIIGSTGAGKSTLINLIPRFYDATEGIITLDGVNIKDVDLEKLRQKIGYVPQKGLLFSGTISSNIAFGMKHKQQEQIKKSAQIAQAENFILDKEKEYDSEISQGANNVSGGQKQRLAIARAIAKAPEIYIFDDSFSALDFKTDAKLRKELKKITKKSTIIMVAQRVSTIMNADQILVLEEGKIIGQGTHQELIKKCDIYREIALSQLGEEEAKNV